MRRKFKTTAIAFLASIMLLSGLGLSAQPVSASTYKQIRVHCTAAPLGGWVRIYGWNQYNSVVNGIFPLNQSEFANTANWLWRDNQSVIVLSNPNTPDPDAYWEPHGDYKLEGGGSGGWWDTLTVPC